ncbi:MAG: hypothetical protein D6701_14440 [Gemmatimonadetes bacterium]|nr:MAG: hypothetical protein D6701_14440 [Gemmatimonadota bacterium]
MDGAWSELLGGHCRTNRSYALEKFTFFDRYLPAAFRATKRKRTRHFVDLFAGSGVWRDEAGDRHLGSPLHVLRLSTESEAPGFTEFFFVNKDRRPEGHLRTAPLLRSGDGASLRRSTT